MAAVAKRLRPNVCYYTIEKLRSGRRSTGSTVVDAHGAGTQLKGNTRLSSLEEPAAVEEETGGELTFHDVLSRDEEDPVSEDGASSLSAAGPESPAGIKL